MPESESAPAVGFGRDRAASGVQGERRIVTVLFCDVTGSTAIAEQLDPEEWADILHGLYEKLTACVQRYEGTVARLLGDAVLALFGAPVAHEDDPARAVLAGLAMIEAVAEYRRDVLRRYGHDFNVRIGINTGLVVVGGMGSAQRTEYTAVGDAVNVAARMEQTAQPGTVQIAHDTFRFVAPRFDVEELGTIDVKGKSDPVRAYRVLRARPAASRTHSVLSAPLVGRSHEMIALRRAIDFLRQGRGQVVSVIGEAGLGKSRLLAELRNTLASEGQLERNASLSDDGGSILWLEGRSFSYERSTPYAPFMRVFASLAGLNGDLPHSEQVDGIKAALTRLLPDHGEELTSYIAALFAPAPDSKASVPPDPTRGMDSQQLRAAIFDSVRTVIAALARRQPVVLVLEDLHWIDPTSLDLLLHLLPLTTQVKLAIVAVYRLRPDELTWRFHNAASTDHSERYTSLVLGRLSDENAQTLVDHLLVTTNLPPQVSRLILDKAEGNPFFVEEVVRSLIDAGGLEHSDGEWRTTRAIEHLAVPDTLSGVITARLDRLEPASKRVAQTAAVIGRAFAVDVLADVLAADASIDGELDDILMDLERRELIRPALGRSRRSYMFKHVLTQETAYASLLLSRRREIHRRVAECLERTEPENAIDLARHFMEARAPERAFPYYVQAGDRAARAHAAQEAISHYSRALEAAEQSGEQAFRVRSARGHTYEIIGDFDAAQADFESALQAAREHQDRHSEWQALLDLGYLWASRDYDKTGEYYHQALELSRIMEDPAVIADSLNRVGNWYVNVERPRTGSQYHQEALEIWEELGDLRGIATTLDLYGLARYRNGDVPKALDPYRRAIDLFRRVGDRYGLSSSLCVAGMVGGVYMDNDIAVPVPVPMEDRIALVEESLQIAQSIHWRAGEAFSHIAYARILGIKGEIGSGLEHAEAGLAIAQEIGHRQWICAATSFKGHLYGLVLAWEQCQKYQESALTLARTINSPLWINMVSGVLAAAYLYQNKPDAAHVVLDAALDPDTPIESYSQRRCWAMRAELALVEGDAATALSIVERLYSGLSGLESRTDVPYLALLYGEALAALDRGEEAEAIFRQLSAGDFFQAWRPFRWRVQLAQTRYFRESGRYDEAAQAEEQARATLDSIAAAVPDPSLRNIVIENALRALRSPQIRLSP